MCDSINNYLDVAIKTALTTGIAGSVLTFLGLYFKAKIKSLIQYSTKLIFDKQLENYKTEISNKQKAVILAEIFTEWIIYNRKDTEDNSTKLNKLVWEASIWLPKDILEELNKRLKNDTEAKAVFEIVIEARKLIWQDKKEHINKDAINNFMHYFEKK